MSDIKWIPLGGMNLSAANLAATEKLRRFGFAVICGEFGSEKYTKACLSIFDVLQEKDNPSILIITSQRELYGWYRILMTELGADFKVITGAPGAITFFSKDCPNLFLMSKDALMGQNALRTKAGMNFAWDLIIIDEEQNTDVPAYSDYTKGILWKAEKLLVISPFPARTEDDRNALVNLIKGVLDDKTLGEEADILEFGINSSRLDGDIPSMRYFDQKVCTGEIKRSISFCEYTLDESAIKASRRRIDIKTGAPVYKYAGNVFEDYDTDEMKKIYEKGSYTRSDVEDLRAYDKKLDSFLNLMEEITSEANSRIMVYCCERNTIDYLRKALSCVFGSSAVRTAKGDLFRKEDIFRKLRVDDTADYPKIILGVDALGAVGDGFDRINYIVNYELPDSAVLLERRLTRHGSTKEAVRKFIVFRDTNKMFDSVMLDKVLYGSIESAFCGNLAGRNILLEADSKADSVNALVADLKYIVGYASEIDNCFDLIKRVKSEYALLGAQSVTNGKQLAEFAKKILERVCKVFGFTAESSAEEITAAVNALGGLCYLNDDGKLEKLSAEDCESIAKSFDDESYMELSFAAEAVKGLEQAKKDIDEWHSGDNFHLTIKQETAALADCLLYPVLYGIWRYRVREQDSTHSFRDYIAIYNDGI